MKLLAILLKRVIGFIRARPKLDFFLRRQVSRVPVLPDLLRRVLARSRRQGWSLSQQARLADEDQLPQAAIQVLRDLQQAASAVRPPLKK